MKKNLVLTINIILISIIVILISGCQPTPTREAVVNAGRLEEAIASSAASSSAYDAPENWQETLDIKGSDATIDIDAAISVPDVTAFPIYKIKKVEFDTEKIEELVEYFANGKDVIKDKVQTKTQLEEELVIAKKDNDEQWMTQLEEMIETAPVTIPDEIITDWNPVQSPSGNFLDENGVYAGISASPDYFTYLNGNIIQESMLLSIKPDDPELFREKAEIGEVSILKDNAIEAGQKLLHGLGINYMTAASLEKALCCKSFSDIFTDSGQKPLSKGYLIKFVRNIDGISGIINEGIIYSIYDDFAYRAPLCAETIQIFVNEAGQTQFFTWQFPLVIEQKASENAELMRFEEMKQRIRDMLTFINSYNSGQIKVTNIEMHMTIVDVRDQPNEAMYVPAWFIDYTKTYKEISQEYRLVLNAIDGGRVLEAPIKNDPEIQQAMDADRENLLKKQ